MFRCCAPAAPSVNGVPVTEWRASVLGTAPAHRPGTTRHCACVCAIWLPHACALALAASTSGLLAQAGTSITHASFGYTDGRAVAQRLRLVQPAPTAPHQRWRRDGMRDRVHDGRRCRVVPCVDTMTRARPHRAVARSCSGRPITAMLDTISQRIGLPAAMQRDTGPEFPAQAVAAWAARKHSTLRFRRPGTPADTPYNEACTGR